jgi:hypothetical protein
MRHIANETGGETVITNRQAGHASDDLKKQAGPMNPGLLDGLTVHDAEMQGWTEV